MRKPRGKTSAGRKAAPGMPSREQVLEFLAENPGVTGKREIARAFGLTGSDKIALKALLKEMAQEGAIEKKGRRVATPGSLPSVGVLDIFGRDGSGGLLARPVQWDEADGPSPVIHIRSPSGRHAGARATVAGVGDRVLARIEKSGEGFSAKVMKRLEKRREAVLGVVREGPDGMRLVPAVKKQDEILLDLAGTGAKPGDLVEAEAGRASRFGPARGRVTRVIGSMLSEKAASAIAIHLLDIPHVFPQAALDEARTTKDFAIGGKAHEDWRDLPLVTIDPADAKDHDDAIHGKPDPEVPGGHIVTVAIADVSFHVPPGSAMDVEARKRGNSVYFPDQVVPMLPERISNDLCSLRENQVRPALAVRMWFSPEGRKVRHEFHRIAMRSHARLSYPQAQAAIDGNADDKTAPILETVLKPLWESWRCLHRGREAREPLELDLPERKILLKEDGTVDRVIVPPRLDAHRLVEEFMIQANVSAAETLESRRQRLVYRIHDAPTLSKLESLREFLRSMNLSLAKAGAMRAAHFNRVLEQAAKGEREELVSQVVLRSQSQAEYSPANIGHFGLNLARYAHFTSPIRRYADLIVHRALVSALALGPGGLPREQEEQLEAIAEEISMAERRAVQAERDTVDRLIAQHLSERIGERFDGRVTGVTKAGLFVTLSGTGADGFIPISMIGDEYYVYDEANHALTGSAGGLSYQLGQVVEVRLAEAAPVSGALRFEMMTPGKAVHGLVRSMRTNARGMRQGKRNQSRRHGRTR
jgi:ribonuclease R